MKELVFFLKFNWKPIEYIKKIGNALNMNFTFPVVFRDLKATPGNVLMIDSVLSSSEVTREVARIATPSVAENGAC